MNRNADRRRSDGSEEVNKVWGEVGEKYGGKEVFGVGIQIDNERALIRARVCVFPPL